LKVERLHGMELKNHREAKDAALDWLLQVQRIEDALDLEPSPPIAVRTASRRLKTHPAA